MCISLKINDLFLSLIIGFLFSDESMLYLVCLVKSDERVLATSGGSATREHLSNMALTLPGQIKLEKLLSDFKVTIEVYNMTLSKEMLPHDVKYHINNRKVPCLDDFAEN